MIAVEPGRAQGGGRNCRRLRRHSDREMRADLVLNKKTAIPASWIDVVTESDVILAVSARLLQGLPDYDG